QALRPQEADRRRACVPQVLHARPRPFAGARRPRLRLDAGAVHRRLGDHGRAGNLYSRGGVRHPARERHRRSQGWGGRPVQGHPDRSRRDRSADESLGRGRAVPDRERTFLGHPVGLSLLFVVEMWERFSYYGMRALLVLYLARSAAGENPGRGWSKEASDNLFGWYTGMAYLLPIVGGLIADRLIGTHRSLVIGALVIALGHIVLAASGIGALAGSALGMSVFIAGLVL